MDICVGPMMPDNMRDVIDRKQYIDRSSVTIRISTQSNICISKWFIHAVYEAL